MGHVIFVIMHIMAIIFGFVFLFITIPLHLIFCVIKDRGLKEEVIINRNCPFCQELIHRDATICKYCNKEVPVYVKPIKTREELETERNIARGIY